MPLQSSQVFCSHIGHTGKTTLCFQVACWEAKRNPGTSVLVVDFAEEGDLTKRLLGGPDQARSLVQSLFGGIFSLTAAADSSSRAFLFGRSLDIDAHLVRVSEHNQKVPSNLFLISSGAWPRDEPEMNDETRDRVAKKIQESLRSSSKTWKLFCDTDGDRRPNSLTKLAYSLCAHAIVPLHLSKSDLDRTETMLGMMAMMREQGQIQTQVAAVVWNGVKVNKDEPCVHSGLNIPFRPTKVSLDMLDSCNTRLFQIALELKDSGLFMHGDASREAFVQRTAAVVRELSDNVLKPSEELGVPVVRMMEDLAGRSSVPFTSGGVKYDASGTTVQSVDRNIEALAKRLDVMVLGE